jgi:hypothetical protein
LTTPSKTYVRKCYIHAKLTKAMTQNGEFIRV